MAENNPKQKRRTPSWCAQLPNRLGRRMTEYCLRKGWSLYVLSAASGVPLTTIAHSRTGRQKIREFIRSCGSAEHWTFRWPCFWTDWKMSAEMNENKKEKQGGFYGLRV